MMIGEIEDEDYKVIYFPSFPPSLPGFYKSAATATTQPSETTMDRAFGWVVAAPFFRW